MNGPENEDFLIHSTFLRAQHASLAASCERARQLTAGLDESQLNWKPSPDKWSVAQCLDHIMRGSDDYAGNMRPAIEKGRAKGRTADGDIEPRHSFMGKMVIAYVEPTAKRTMKAPKGMRPSQSNIPIGIVDRFVASHETIMQLAVECDGLDFNRIRMPSPELSIVIINLADAFEILSGHAIRHLNQAERVKEAMVASG